MIYKTQQFTNQELEDLVKGLSVTKVTPKKKGEVTEKELPHQEVHSEGIYKIDERHKEGIWNIEVINTVGDIAQAVNEKGKKLWYCPECKEIKESEVEFMKSHHLRFCFKLGAKKPKKIKFAKPLLVRLEEIEKKRAEEMHGFHQWIETFKMVEK